MTLAGARAAASIFDPQRLRVARQLRRLTRSALAGRVGVSGAAVGQWEAGAVRPKAQTLADVAHVLSFPVGYFATSGRTPSNLDTEFSFFRSLRKSKEIDREAAQAHAVLLAELISVIERHAVLPSLAIPEYPTAPSARTDEVDTVAMQLRRDWNLHHEPVADMVSELERHGAVAARLRLAGDVDAFSWPGIDRPIVILVSDKADKARSRFDAAHELGHLVMHRRHPRSGDRDLERQAHRFASVFLVPSEPLAAEWPKGRLGWRELIALKRRWQVSMAALLYRAREDGLMEQTTYESAVKYMSRAGWRRSEPGELGPPERPQLLGHAVRALAQHGIDAQTLRDEAQLPADILNEYLQPPHELGRITVEL